jgi:hypothetical protein
MFIGCMIAYETSKHILRDANDEYGTGKKKWNPYYEICNCTTKSMVYPYYIHILWKYTIIMDNQNPFYFQ